MMETTGLRGGREKTLEAFSPLELNFPCASPENCRNGQEVHREALTKWWSTFVSSSREFYKGAHMMVWNLSLLQKIVILSSTSQKDFVRWFSFTFLFQLFFFLINVIYPCFSKLSLKKNKKERGLPSLWDCKRTHSQGRVTSHCVQHVFFFPAIKSIGF